MQLVQVVLIFNLQCFFALVGGFAAFRIKIEAMRLDYLRTTKRNTSGNRTHLPQHVEGLTYVRLARHIPGRFKVNQPLDDRVVLTEQRNRLVIQVRIGAHAVFFAVANRINNMFI